MVFTQKFIESLRKILVHCPPQRNELDNLEKDLMNLVLKQDTIEESDGRCPKKNGTGRQ